MNEKPIDETALKLMYIIKGILEDGGKVDMAKAAEKLKEAVPEMEQEIDRAMRQPGWGEEEPTWGDFDLSTKDGILIGLGEEAFKRLLERPTAKERLKAVESVMNNPTSRGVNDLDSFMYHFLTQAIDVGVKTGYALCLTEGRVCDFEEWLSKAITAAGLTDYKPTQMDWDKYVNR